MHESEFIMQIPGDKRGHVCVCVREQHLWQQERKRFPGTSPLPKHTPPLPKVFGSVCQRQRKHSETDHLHPFDTPWGCEYRVGEEISILTSTNRLFKGM